MSKRKLTLSRSRLALASAALAALQQPALAAADTGNLTINASVTAQCFIDDATLDFGTFGVWSASAAAGSVVLNTVTASAEVPIICTNGTSATLAASENALNLTAEGNSITVELYSDAGMASAYPTTPGSLTFAGSGTADSTKVYGKVTAVADTKAGAYTGTVTLTVSY